MVILELPVLVIMIAPPSVQWSFTLYGQGLPLTGMVPEVEQPLGPTPMNTAIPESPHQGLGRQVFMPQ